MAERAAGVRLREWLHPWHGMTFGVWLRMLRRNGFAVSPSRLPRAVAITAATLVNVPFARQQQRRFGARIEATELPPAPVFIIGHWRSGTTFLHELLARDPRFVFPTTYECFAPAHFLVTQGWARRHLAQFLPANRPMDAVRVGFERPQEDEFALLNLGLASPYETIAFPNRRPRGGEFLDPDMLDAQQLAMWTAGFLRFLRSVTFRAERKGAVAEHRLLLKSPSHTARLGLLRRLFPDAAFIHIARDPYEIFASTRRLWTRLYSREALQKPRLAALPGGVPDLDDYILASFDRLYRDFDRQTALLPERQFCAIRYEDLTAHPLATVEAIYARLGWGGFGGVRDALGDHLANAAYAPNRHDLAPEIKAKVARRWGYYFARHGYPIERAADGMATRGLAIYSSRDSMAR